MGTDIIRVTFWVLIFFIMNVAMVTSHLMTGRYIPIFRLNILMFILSLGEFSCFLPHNGNDIASLFEAVKSQGR